jgi:FkbM family methyltransferase
MRISRILYKPLAYLFYAHVKGHEVPSEREVNLWALGIKSKMPIKLSLNPCDQGFSKEFSLYGFREILNSLFVYYIVRKYRPSVVIDIGANLGYYVALEALAGAEKIIAVEPVPPTYSYLCRNLKTIENAVALNVAVADRDGEVSMTVSDSFNLAHVTEGESDASCCVWISYSRKSVFPEHLDKKVGIAELEKYNAENGHRRL